jgi:predicted transcriptional regulator
MPAPLKTLKERKARYKEVIKLLEQGHTMTSAGKLVGLTQPAISRIAKSYGFKRRVNAIEQVILGKVKSSLVKRAVGYKTTKEYQQLDRNGNVVDLIEEDRDTR